LGWYLARAVSESYENIDEVKAHREEMHFIKGGESPETRALCGFYAIFRSSFLPP